MIFSVFLIFAGFVISLVGTRLLLVAFRNKRLMLDVPNARSNHANPVPKGGGLAVIFALVIPMLVADIEIPIVLSVFLLAAISFMDDLIGVPAIVRLLVQVIAVSIPLSMLPIEFSQGYLPPVAEKIIIGLLWIWFINLFNFMDGIDGITAIEMISIGLGIAFLMIFADLFPNPLSHYAMIMAAVGLGFWWWNRHPAKIFMGDVGSVPVGFLAGYLLLMMALSGYVVAALIIPGYYIADATITLIHRLYKREKIWVAHSSHYYQRAARKGWKHNMITHYIAGINILLGLIAVYSMLNPAWQWLYVPLAYMAVCMLLGFFGHGKNPNAGDAS